MSVRSLAAPGGPRRALAVTLAGLLLVTGALWFFWPLGVAIGLATGVLVVLGLGQQQDRAAERVPLEDLFGLESAPVDAVVVRPQAASAARTAPAPGAPAVPAAPAAPAVTAAPAVEDRGVRADLDRLKAALGDDYPDFARAARLVVSTQYASAARLQRDLQLPYSRARRLLADLETEHFVGPATGTLPRQVLFPKERLPEVERLFAGV